MKRSLWIVLGLVVSLLCTLTALAKLPANQSGSRGIYVMEDNVFNNIDQAHGFPVAGGHKRFSWKELEPTKGNYRFDDIRSFVNLEVGRGKKASFGIETFVGRINQTAPYGSLRVPQWLWETYPTVIKWNTRGGVEPWWTLDFMNSAYQSNYAAFVNALADWLAANMDVAANIGWIDIGVGLYGETQPSDFWRQANYPDYVFYVQNLGYTADSWLGYVNWCTDTYAHAFRVRQSRLSFITLFLNCAPDFPSDSLGTGAGRRTAFTDYAAIKGLGLKNNGLQADRRPAGLYAPLEKWSTIAVTISVPIAWETYQQFLTDETEFYWGMLCALDKHPDVILPDRDLFINASGTPKTRYVEVYNWVNRYLAVDPWTTQGVWCALRDTNPPDSGGERDNFSFYMFQRDDYGPNGGTVVEYNVTPGQREGAFTRRTDQATGNRYIWFRIADQFMQGYPSGAPFTVIVTYLDRNTDTWQLWYDSTTGLKSAGSVTKSNSGLWKQATFTLTDAKFANGIGNSSDLRLDCNADGDDYFHMVEVKKGTGDTTPSPTPTRTQTPVACTLQGSVTLQRLNMPAPPDPSWVTELTVSVGGTNHAVTTDQAGNFVLNNLTPGTYDIRVKSRHSLRNIKSSVTLNSGTNTIHFGTLLEGDASDNNCVYMEDFYLLKDNFNTADPRPDFNQDGIVNIFDFYPIKWNFNQCGDLPVSSPQSGSLSKSGTETTLTGSARLSVQPMSTAAVEGQVFGVTIQIDAGTQSVDAAEIHLDFDPTYLQVVDANGNPADVIELGSAFEAEMRNHVDNATGVIDLAAGTFGVGSSGSFALATIHFRALQVTDQPGTSLTFVSRQGSDTDVAYNALSVLGDLDTGVVAIKAQPSLLYLPIVHNPQR